MKAEIRQQWLEALRSGQYTQGHRYLRRSNNTYCCLGVLCDLVGPNDWKPQGAHHYSHSTEYTALLPPVIANAVGLRSSFVDQDPLDVVMRMNDTGKSFAEIADWIEANIPAESDSTGASES